MKPKDFRLLSEYGPIEGANIVDWPITYEELEPYYAKVRIRAILSFFFWLRENSPGNWNCFVS